jgi:hypothetical protein
MTGNKYTQITRRLADAGLSNVAAYMHTKNAFLPLRSEIKGDFMTPMECIENGGEPMVSLEMLVQCIEREQING